MVRGLCMCYSSVREKQRTRTDNARAETLYAIQGTLRDVNNNSGSRTLFYAWYPNMSCVTHLLCGKLLQHDRQNVLTSWILC